MGNIKEENQLIPKGYKKTELGIIPEDWQINRICELGKIVTGSTPSTRIKYYWGGNIPWVTPTDISAKKNIFTTERKITEDGLKAIRELPENSILITCIASIGKNVILKKRGACNQQINAIIPNKNYSYEFLYYLMEFNKNYLLSKAGMTATNIISKKDFSEIIFPISPVIEEQKAIAVVLSDMDELIESIDKLIEKKKLIKQGAMQELLTGKRRLPGFSGDWEVKKLGEILEYEQPTKYIVKSTEYIENASIPVLTAGKTFILGYTEEKNGVFTKVPVVIFDDFTTENKYVDFNFKVKSSAMKILKLKDNSNDLRFIYGKIQLISFVLGVGGHKRYWISEYQHIKIEIPSYAEQTAIAAVLSDIDAEIEALKRKRDKYKQIKQGAMQVLLTGKIRLI
ncbi:MAG: restriction endonuclease subunit S [bacterium]